MKLTFLGAAHEVTGSMALIEIGGRFGIVDCGMEQGMNMLENAPLPIDPSKLEFVLLTHAHIDHSGNLPLLYKNGFTGPIYATRATTQLCRIMLRDSANIQESEAEWKNRKAKRSGDERIEPKYTMEDAEAAIAKLRPCSYGEILHIAEGVAVRFVDAGHLMGSASIEVWLKEGELTKKVVFSGDIGNENQPIIKNPQYIDEADYVVTESTYGDRYHEKTAGTNSTGFLAECIQRTLDRGGNVVIPSFAVGRTQELLYFIREIKDKGLVKGHEGFPVYVDSPLANEATGVFLQVDRECFDAETRKLLEEKKNPLMFKGLHTSVSVEESKSINADNEPKVIISASGMCEAGRIRHHLKHNLWRRENMILFVGYQAAGSLGRIILDGAKKVKLFGEEITIEAEVSFLPGKSGHADKGGLIKWITAFKKKPQMVFVNHGADEVCEAYAKCLVDEYGFNAMAPYSGTIYDLAQGRVTKETTGIPIVKKVQKAARSNAFFDSLVAACERLLKTAKGSSGIPNKELSSIANQVSGINTKLESWTKKK